MLHYKLRRKNYRYTRYFARQDFKIYLIVKAKICFHKLQAKAILLWYQNRDGTRVRVQPVNPLVDEAVGSGTVNAGRIIFAGYGCNLEFSEERI